MRKRRQDDEALVFSTRCQQCRRIIRVGNAEWKIESHPELMPEVGGDDDDRAVVVDPTSPTEVFILACGVIGLLAPTRIWNPTQVPGKQVEFVLCAECLDSVFKGIETPADPPR